MTWLKDGAVLTNDSRTTNDSQVTIFTELVREQGVVFVQSTLEICGLDAEDSGTYYCTATNQLGMETSAFEITVEPAGKYFTSVSELQVCEFCCEKFASFRPVFMPSVEFSWAAPLEFLHLNFAFEYLAIVYYQKCKDTWFPYSL